MRSRRTCKRILQAFDGRCLDGCGMIAVFENALAGGHRPPLQDCGVPESGYSYCRFTVDIIRAYAASRIRLNTFAAGEVETAFLV